MCVGVRQIRVGGFQVGVIGLIEVFEEVRQHEPADREELAQRLLDRVRAENYVAPGFESEYRKALLREYCKRYGLPFEEEAPHVLHIQVLGPGCFGCDRLYAVLQELLIELNLPAELEHVRDRQEIARHKIFGTPGLVINGTVKWAGSVPPRPKLREWIQEAAKAVR